MSKPTYFYKPIPGLPIVPNERAWVTNLTNPNFPTGRLIHTSRVEIMCEDGKSFETVYSIYKEQEEEPKTPEPEFIGCYCGS